MHSKPEWVKHRGHLKGENRDGDCKCYQCGVVIKDHYFLGKPDVTSAWKPSIKSYFGEGEDESGY